MKKITFIKMLESDSHRGAFPQSTQHHMVVAFSQKLVWTEEELRAQNDFYCNFILCSSPFILLFSKFMSVTLCVYVGAVLM